MLLIAGLGNPGSRYADNRHNIGFMAVDSIARHQSFSPWTRKFKSEIAEGALGGQKTLLIKPQSFMNVSGEPIGETMRFYKLSTDDLIVIYDELDLVPGKARIKTGGGHGGHNGIRSIAAHCGNDFTRLRLGIGHPGARELVNKHVLGNFAKQDREWLDPLLEAIGVNAAMLAGGEHSSFLNKIALAAGEAGKKAEAAKNSGQSHIHAARRAKPDINKASGPMAGMLKKLFGNKDG
ncbi:aminoacyl-tRNA hydrolase [Hoeflea sp. WL0058]|uniref:Peptidyl-tRNA hydrolase n=1 Tax=Flavimaribacter sediminis TaxID=2865987 RepID=A0AAE2ZQ25_9HYPH|nr:aminoacyl-tRNA hydrolase [Flavimaribacter sediminis]MBW8638791.1 aminoacyl-tRNA hydrolase [Flavimaribacter sediminis]